MVFHLRADVERYRWLTPTDPQAFSTLFALDSGERVVDWRPIAVHLLEEEEHEGRPLSDFPYLRGWPVFSAWAVACLRDLLEGSAQLLPLRSPVGELHLCHVTRTIDALDERRSTLERFRSSGRVKRITGYVFRDEAVGDHPLFRIPQAPRDVFVTSRFVERVERAGLTGFELEQLWSG